MASTDTFNGAKSAFTFFYAYLNAVGQEIGMERAIALDAKMCEMMGAAQGRAMKDQAGLHEIDIAMAASLAGRSIEEALGISSEAIEESAQRIASKVGRCPVYEAAEALGMDGASIEAICRASSLRYMDTMVKQWNPHLSYRLRVCENIPSGNDEGQEETGAAELPG
jgi:hypothetical protein